jgi:hypothetical protein
MGHVRNHKRVGAEVQGLGLTLERDYCRTNFVGSVNFERIDGEPEVGGRSLNIGGFTKSCRIGGIGQHRQPSECGNHLNQKLDPFSGNISRLKRQSGDIAPGVSRAAHKTASQWIRGRSEYNGDR